MAPWLIHHEFADSKYYPGIARDKGNSARPIRTNPQSCGDDQFIPLRIPARSRCMCRRITCQAPWSPFMVGADGPDRMLFTALDS